MAPIYFIAGAPAVGKSSTARALASRFQKSIHIPVDDVRNMVVSGLVQPGEWHAALIEQLRLARASVAQMALTYTQAGFVVVIDDFWDPNSRLTEYAGLFQTPQIHRVLLFPSRQSAEERNLKRSGPGGASEYIAGGIRAVYEHLSTDAAMLEQQGWMVVNTTDKDIEATVEHILRQ